MLCSMETSVDISGYSEVVVAILIIGDGLSNMGIIDQDIRTYSHLKHGSRYLSKKPKMMAVL